MPLLHRHRKLQILRPPPLPPHLRLRPALHRAPLVPRSSHHRQQRRRDLPLRLPMHTRQQSLGPHHPQLLRRHHPCGLHSRRHQRPHGLHHRPAPHAFSLGAADALESQNPTRRNLFAQWLRLHR